MNKNNLYKTFLLTVLVVAALTGLFYMPRITVMGHTLRRVNMLSDVQRRDSAGNIIAELEADRREGVEQDVLDQEAVRVNLPKYQDDVPEGMVVIEDFKDSLGYDREMDKFYAALNEANKRPVRIAYFGDSFIEGDIVAGDLRELLQSKYGGKGVGWVDITSITAGFKRTVLHWANGWESHSANNEHKNGFDEKLSGPGGRYFYPRGTATLNLKGETRIYGEHLDKVQRATVFYANVPGTQFTARINDSIDAQFKRKMGKNKVLCSAAVAGDITKFDMKANGGNARFYGVALDNAKGISVDNFSMRSSDGKFLSKIPLKLWQDFAEMRKYDLIIMHFGLNVANPNVRNYTKYTEAFKPVIDNMKKAYPEASLMIVSVSDHDTKQNGEWRTQSGIKELVSYQRKMAADAGIAFWNMFEGMGGEGSIARMRARDEANLDYAHINFKGGKVVGKTFFESMMNGKKNYDKRTKTNKLAM